MRRYLIVAVFLTVGCQPGHRYEGRTPTGGLPEFALAGPTPPPTTPTEAKPVPPVPPQEKVPASIGWLVAANPPLDTEIVFRASDGPDGARLKDFWNYDKEARLVEIKVPVGLPDPTPFIPAANRPTVKKWALGKKLFFDEDYLDPTRKISCAACHLPAQFYSRNPGYRDGPLDGFDTPVLINVVYQPRVFWDGRAILEEVVQQTLEDERQPPPGATRRHVWPGVIGRLAADSRWTKLFEETFGVRQPNQDMVGKAMATYLRTVLAGNSLYDRALQAAQVRKSAEPQADDFVPLLDNDALESLGRSRGTDPKEVAAWLQRGHQLFHDRGPTAAGCYRCHPGPTFSDGAFHNIGVEAPEQRPDPGQETGRFRSLPIGLKDPGAIAAFKTPTLRGLPRSKPYLHDFSAREIEHAIKRHYEGPTNPFLSPWLRDPPPLARGETSPCRTRKSTPLLGFVRSLAGTDLHEILANQQKFPPPAVGGP